MLMFARYKLAHKLLTKYLTMVGTVNKRSIYSSLFPIKWDPLYTTLNIICLYRRYGKVLVYWKDKGALRDSIYMIAGSIQKLSSRTRLKVEPTSNIDVYIHTFKRKAKRWQIAVLVPPVIFLRLILTWSEKDRNSNLIDTILKKYEIILQNYTCWR